MALVEKTLTRRLLAISLAFALCGAMLVPVAWLIGSDSLAILGAQISFAGSMGVILLVAIDLLTSVE